MLQETEIKNRSCEKSSLSPANVFAEIAANHNCADTGEAYRFTQSAVAWTAVLTVDIDIIPVALHPISNASISRKSVGNEK